MVEQIDLAGRFALPGTAMTLNRVGYGATQLAGQDGNKLVWGPPRDTKGFGAPYRAEQRHSRADRRSPSNRSHRLRTEPLQPRTPN
jgi:hypothetical protein